MKLLVILGSTRPGRKSERMANWVAQGAKSLPETDAEIVDLKDYQMPFFDEPVSPRFNNDRKPHPEVQRWMDKMKTGDAYIFVTPEYNHSMPGVLKNAIDYLTTEMYKKPASVASHGTVGGARATVHLKDTLSESGAMVITRQIAMAGMSEKIDENGELSAEQKAQEYGPVTSLKNMLEELKWHSDTMAAGRVKDAASA